MQVPAFSTIMINTTTMKMESQLENGTHLKENKFTKKVIFLTKTPINLHKYHGKTQFQTKN